MKKKKGMVDHLAWRLAGMFMKCSKEHAIRMKIRDVLCSLSPMERTEVLLQRFYSEWIGLFMWLLLSFVVTGAVFQLFGTQGRVIIIGGLSGVSITRGKAFFLLTALGALLVARKRSAFQRACKERDQQLRMDYPQIVSKLTILFLAGLTIREAWEKIVMAYIQRREQEKKKRYAYEEMLLAYRELQGGMSEGEVYNRFGRRCRLSCYMKLSALLVQNLKKGNKGLAQLLAYEGVQALEERKNLAKKLGEEASTKMLLPMILMLFLVIVILIVPAFMTMQF